MDFLDGSSSTDRVYASQSFVQNRCSLLALSFSLLFRGYVFLTASKWMFFALFSVEKRSYTVYFTLIKHSLHVVSWIFEWKNRFRNKPIIEHRTQDGCSWRSSKLRIVLTWSKIDRDWFNYFRYEHIILLSICFSNNLYFLLGLRVIKSKNLLECP